MRTLRELTKEELKVYAANYLTVGRLKQFLNAHQLSDDAIVVVQRVHDVYYEKHNWGSYLKKGEDTYRAEQLNRDIASGEFHIKFKYRRDNNPIPYTIDEIKDTMEQYHPAFCCTTYKDDTDVLFINLHY